MSKIEELLEIVKNLSDEEKNMIQQVLKPKKKPIKKTVRKKVSANSMQVFDQKDAMDDPEVKKATEITKILNNGKKNISIKRQRTKLVKVKCPNCNRSYSVTTDLAKNFVCCFKRKK